MRYRFGPFEIDLSSFELRREGQPVPTQRLTLDTLAYLLEHRDRVVTRDELLRGPWGGTIVSDGAVSQSLSLVRKAVDDDGDRQEIIRTVRGRGFQFVAPVEVVAAVASPTSEGAPERTVFDTPFAGRDSEIASLASWIDNARAGRGSTSVLVLGEPGVGKTTLAKRFADAAAERGALVAWGRCRETRGGAPFDPWVQIMRRLLESPAWSRRSEIAAARVQLEPLFPELRAGRSPLPRRADNLESRDAVFAVVADVFARIAQVQPLVLILDDLHAADEPTLRLASAVTRMLGTAPVMLLATMRDTEAPTSEPARELLANGLGGGEVIRLRGLDVPHVGPLLERLVEATVPTTITSRVHALTGGNPFLIVGLARVYRTGGGFDALARALEDYRVPERAAHAVRRNVAALPEPTRAVLAGASVVGREFDLAVLATALAREPLGVLEALEPAIATGLVRASGYARFTFAHALVAETLYGDVATTTRMTLHRAVGDALESAANAGTPVPRALLAHHFAEAAPAGRGDAAKAVLYARLAAEDAVARFAYEEGVAAYERALAALALAGDDAGQRLELLVALAAARRFAGQHRRAIECCEHAASLARERDNAEALARVVVTYGEAQTDFADFGLLSLCEEALARLGNRDDALRALLLARAATTLNFMPRWDERDAAVRESVALSAALGDDRIRGRALQAQRWCLDERNKPAASLEMSSEAVRVLDRAGEISVANEMRRWKIGDHLRCGQRDAFVREIATHRATVARLADPWHRAWEVRFDQTIAMLEGRIADAEQLAANALAAGQTAEEALAVPIYWMQMIEIRRERGVVTEVEPFVRHVAETLPWNPAWRAALTIVLAEHGRDDEARASLEMLAPDAFAVIPPDMNILTALSELAESAVLLGERGHAETLHRALAPHVGRWIVVGAGLACLGPVDYYAGLLDASLERYAAANEHFATTLAMAESLDAELWRVRARHGMARAYWGAGESERAVTSMREVLSRANSLGLEGVIRRARRLDGALYAAATAPPT